MKSEKVWKTKMARLIASLSRREASRFANKEAIRADLLSCALVAAPLSGEMAIWYNIEDFHRLKVIKGDLGIEEKHEKEKSRQFTLQS